MFFFQMIPPFLLLFSLAAEGTIIAIALERYHRISNPIIHRLSTQSVGIAFIFVWTTSVSAVSPFIWSLQAQRYENLIDSVCVENWTASRVYASYLNSTKGNQVQELANLLKPSTIYSLLLFVVTFSIPMSIITLIHQRNLYLLNHQKKSVSGLVPLKYGTKRSCDVKDLGLFSLVAVAYGICVLSHHLSIILSAVFAGKLSRFQSTALYLVTNLIYPIHCAVNPVIYTILSSKFRRDVGKCLKRNDRREKRQMKSVNKYSLTKSVSRSQSRSDVGSNCNSAVETNGDYLTVCTI